MLILGLETSCDETGVALYDTDHGHPGRVVVDFFALIDFDLFDGGRNQSQNFEPVFFAGLHCAFYVVKNLTLQGHGGREPES